MDITKEYIDFAIKEAEAGRPEGIPVIPGYSSNNIRRLLNWLCAFGEPNYLEIGTHLGSTLIPALWNNSFALATCIDDWSLEDPDDPHRATRADLEANIKKYFFKNRVLIVEGDMFKIDIAKEIFIPDVNVYFVDGPHDRAAQFSAFYDFDPILAPRFVAIVDDWRWEAPREETRRAFSYLGYTIEAEWELPADFERDEAKWWNILWVAIVNKAG